MSSFQLLGVDTFAPAVAVLTNVTPEHVGWHGSFAAYAAAKRRIARQRWAGTRICPKERR